MGGGQESDNALTGDLLRGWYTTARATWEQWRTFRSHDVLPCAMRRRFRVEPTSAIPRIVCALAASVALGCGSDATVEPVAPVPVVQGYTIRITGDSVAALGQRVTLRATVVDSSGRVAPNASVQWTVGDSAVLTSMVNSVSSVSFLARTGGTTTVSAAWSMRTGVPGTFTVRVNDARPIIPVAIGQQVTGQVSGDVSTNRYALTLTEGDTIDLLTDRRDSLTNVRLRQLVGSLSLVPTLADYLGRSIFGGVVVPTTGTYVFDLLADPACLRGTCVPATGSFVLSARRAGPLFTYFANPRSNGTNVAVPAGGAAAETLWVQNLGIGRMTVRLSTDVPHLAFEQPSVSVSGPSKPAVQNEVPEGAVPVVFRVDASNPQNTQPGNLRLMPDSSAWTMSGNVFSYRISPIVYDSAIRIVARQYVDGIVAPSTGPLYAVAGPKILSIDRSSGAITELPVDQRNYREIFSSADGTVYVHHYSLSTDSRDTVSRLLANGRLETVLANQSPPTVIALAPDGSFYLAHAGVLSRRTTAGDVTVLGSGVAPERGAMVYHPGDSALYYAQGGMLRKFDLATRTDAPRGAVNRFRAFAVDAKGRVVGFEEFSGDVLFLNTQAQIVARVKTPYTSTTVSIVGDTMYGGGPPSSRTNVIWRRNVP